MEEIPIGKIIRTRRRTIALEVTSDATLVIRAPLRVSSVYIEEMIREKSAWILRKMEQMKQRQPPPRHEYTEGESFYFHGRAYPLHIAKNGNMTIERSDRLYVSRYAHTRYQEPYQTLVYGGSPKGNPGTVHVVFHENGARSLINPDYRCTAEVGVMHP